MRGEAMSWGYRINGGTALLLVLSLLGCTGSTGGVTRNPIASSSSSPTIGESTAVDPASSLYVPESATASATGTVSRTFELVSGPDALEPAMVRVRVISDPDLVLAGSRFGTKALPATNTWDSVEVRLSGPALTADRVVNIARTSFTCTGGPPVTSCASSGAVFTQLRPAVGYKMQISVLDSTVTPSNVSQAVENVNFDLTTGSSFNVVITLKRTSTGTGLTVGVTSSGNDSGLYTGPTNNSTTAIAAGIPVVIGDQVSITSGLADATAQAQTTPQGSPSPGSVIFNNLTENETGVLSRVIVSILQGTGTPGTAPAAGEKIIGNFFRSGNEQISGKAWAATGPSDTSSFYGSTNPGTTSTGTPGSVALANTTVAGTLVTGFNNSAVTWTVSKTDTTPNITPVDDESTAATNARIVWRYYDNTYDHHLIAIKTQNLVVDNSASIGLTIN